MAQPFGGDPQAPTALAAPERNHYFYGKLLDVPHLELEQDYLNGKRWLLNRILGGTGVVAGLAVAPAVNGTRLFLQPGIAIDGWGREIVVPTGSVAFDPRTLTDGSGNPAGTLNGAGPVTISLCYQECGINPEPVMAPSCNPAGDCAPGSTREQYALVVKSGSAIGSPVTCGFGDLFKPTAADPKTVPDIHAALATRISQSYSDPSGQGCILLAQVNLPASGPIDASMIDNTIRPIVIGNQVLLELVYCLAQRVQELATP
jgi:hypothetical protein